MERDDYELIDAGDGRRLERWGPRVVDRPAPAATEPALDPGAWTEPDLAFHRYVGWQPADVDPWTVRLDDCVLELRTTEAGQLGAFPEQRGNWAWVAERVGALVASRPDAAEPPAVLNLFGYTGGTTLAAARAGAAVAHVDASRPAVAWARRNAELSGLGDRPVRWLVDDAESFVGREVRRGRRYDGIVLDPPSYGHGRGGRAWRLEERLTGLLDAVASVSAPGAFVLLTAHTPGFDAEALASELAVAFRLAARDVERGSMALTATSGATLELGSLARWPRSARRMPR
ncbi:MAG: class I SAM-dependent methyltransferase [Chloroflexota bacterium]